MKTIKDFDLKGKKVIIRVDFNVPMKDGTITDDNRIVESLNTINYAIDHDAKVILMSHLGRVKEVKDLEKNNLTPVAARLSELLKRDVIFVDETRGEDLENCINSLKEKDVLLMQNTRYEDLEGEKESKNDPELGKYWSSLGDIFINDAFGTSHRAHASNVGISSNLPSGIGFLVEKELKELSVIDKPNKPFTVILGGSKVSDKIGVIKNLVKKADYILVGGGMAYTFLKSQGINIGASLLDEENIEFCKEMLEKHKNKIILPIDSVVTKEIKEGSEYSTKFITDFDNDDIGVDIGHNTVKLFKSFLETSNTVVWNGPVGVFEIKEFSNGTKELCEILSKLSGTTIIGGGDTASAAINMGYKNKFTHISTGGGASLELLEGRKLPGIEIVR